MKEFDIDGIASLAHLEIQPDERERLVRDMERMIALADRMKSERREQKHEITHVSADLREDDILPPIDRDILLSQAPESENGYISVTRVLKEEIERKEIGETV